MLKKIFSRTGLLIQDFEFHPGINIILGRYSGGKDSTGVNGIGKSTLIRLIDFCFLSDSAEKIFNGTKYSFLREEDHNIILEFDFQNKTYFIQRQFQPKAPILFGGTLGEMEEFEKTELKSILTNLFFEVENNEVFFTGNKFRTLFDFFIKDDLDSQKRSDPLNFLKFNANVKDLAIFNFFLLNLPTKNLINYKELSNEYDQFSRSIKSAEEKIKIDTGKSVQDYRGERIIIDQRIDLLEKSLRNFHFVEKYKDVEKQIIDITKRINFSLTEYNSLDKKLEKLKESYSPNQDIETNEIQKIYNEVSQNFGNQVARTLNEVIDFKNSILANRKRYLIQKEEELKEAIKNVLSEISEFEKIRSGLYKILDEKGALDSIKNTYEDLIIEKTDLERNLQLINQIDGYQEMLANLDVTISEVRRSIYNEIKDHENDIIELRKLFHDILINAIFVEETFQNAYFNIQLSSNNRKNLPFKIEVEIPKADALGQSRLKIVAYDLMIFLNNMSIKRRLPDFLIHDGVFHGISLKTKISTINYVYHKYLEYAKDSQFQYIISFNEDEIIVPEGKISEYGGFHFNFEDSIVAEFEDQKDKTIFKRIFG